MAFSCRWRREDGTWRELSWNASLCQEEGLHYRTARVLEPAASELSFRRLIERSPDGVFVHRERRFIYVNSALLKALGYEHGHQLLGRPIWDIVHPDDLEWLPHLSSGEQPSKVRDFIPRLEPSNSRRS